jgi:hypothetical protein
LHQSESLDAFSVKQYASFLRTGLGRESLQFWIALVAELAFWPDVA